MRTVRRLTRRWRSVSFRSGLVAGLAVGLVAGLAAVVLIQVVFALFVVTDGLAQFGLVDRAEDQLRLGVDPAELDLSLAALPDGRRGPDEPAVAFWAVLLDGAVVNSDGEFDIRIVDEAFSDPGFGVEFSPGEEDTRDQLGLKRIDGSEWLYLERPVTTPDATQYVIVAGTQGTFSPWAFLRRSLLGVVPTVLVLMGVSMFITSLLTRRALRRVEKMRAEVEQISQQSLDRRVPTADADDGIDKLANTMNDMLERLEASSAQQHRFLADASHELRSPVAGIVAQLDVAAAYPDRVDTAALLPKLQAEAQRLQSLVNDLLFLSRSEADGGVPSGPVSTVRIDELLTTEVEHQRLVNPDACVKISPTCAASVTGSAPDLQRAVRNLTTNAIRHCDQLVTLGCRVDHSGVIISVSDDGPGVPADDGELIFDRFVRLDAARARDDGGAGLGLAISRQIASRHGGSLELVNPGSPGARFEITLPRS